MGVSGAFGPVEFRGDCECGREVRRPAPTIRSLEVDDRSGIRIRCGCGRIVYTTEVGPGGGDRNG